MRLIFVITILFNLSCSEQQKSEKNNTSEKTTIKFVLNDGKKWQMDEHTRTSIKNLDNLLNSQDVIKSVEGFNQFGKKMDDELILLIRSCTMDGKAHDQLHIFLGYFYPLVQSLKKASEISSAEKIVSEMKELFVQYHKYFK